MIIYNCSNIELLGSTPNSNTFTCNLTLANISSGTAGLYNCTGYIAMDEKLVDSFNLKVEGIANSCSLIIEIVYMHPQNCFLLGSLQNSVLLVTPRNATVEQSCVLTCEVQTSLPVTTSLLSVQWRHRGRLVTTGNGGFVLTQETGNGASAYVTELRFNEIGVEHSGLYSCRVSLDTDRQQVTTEGNLTVTCASQNHNNVCCCKLVFCLLEVMYYYLDQEEAEQLS